MGTFRINTGNAGLQIMTIMRRVPSTCVKMITEILKTMAWAILMIVITFIFMMMLFAKLMEVPAV